MVDPIQLGGIGFAALDTDFQYDALGGLGRLGAHRLEVLEPGGVRQSERVVGPPQTVGRWFSKLLDALTPHGFRQQGKFLRALEDVSARAGKVLGGISLLGAAQGPGVPDHTQTRDALLREVAALRSDARNMTSRGADFDTVLQTRVRVNLDILRREQPEALQTLFILEQNGELDDLIRSLEPDTQGELIHDLTTFQETIRAAMPAQQGASGLDGVDGEGRLAQMEAHELEHPVETPSVPEEPYVSRHEESGLLRALFRPAEMRQRLESALRDRQGTLDQLTGEAKQSLLAALDTIHEALDGHSLIADPASFALVRERVDSRMERAILCATNDVCQFALEHVTDPARPLGVAGQDYIRVSAEQVERELAALGRAVEDRTGVDPSVLRVTTQGAPDSAPPDVFRDGIRRAREQVRDLSALYTDMGEGLDQLSGRARLYQLCLSLRRMARLDPPPGTDRRTFGQTCDVLIDSVLAPATADRGDFQWRLVSLEQWLERSDMPREALTEFRALVPELRRLVLEGGGGTPRIGLNTGEHLARLNAVERLHALHQVIADAGAVLQGCGLPQADDLTGQALGLSRLAGIVEGLSQASPEERATAQNDLRAALSRFMAGMAQARMQVLAPEVRSGVLNILGAKEGVLAPDTLAALTRLQGAAGLLVRELGGTGGQSPVLAAFNQGQRVTELADAAARLCAQIRSPNGKQRAAFEQLSICAASGRLDVDATLRALLTDASWNKSAEGRAAGQAIMAFLDAVKPVTTARGQDTLLRFIDNRMGDLLHAHDITLGLDGSIRMLISTDRTFGTQGTRWITLPRPDSLPQTGKVQTGVHRLDDFFAIPENRAEFYPHFYTVMENSLTHRANYDFTLPGDQR